MGESKLGKYNLTCPNLLEMKYLPNGPDSLTKNGAHGYTLIDVNITMQRLRLDIIPSYIYYKTYVYIA
jgi:hypothetical protein